MSPLPLYPQSPLTLILCHPLLFITHHLSLLCHIIPLLDSLSPLLCNAIHSSLFSITPPSYPISTPLLYTPLLLIRHYLSPLSYAIYSSLSIDTPSPYTMLPLLLYYLPLFPIRPHHPLLFIPVIRCHPHSLSHTIPSLLSPPFL